MSDESASECLSEILDLFRKHNLTAQELCVVYGNLGYSLGAALEGYDSSSKGPGPEELTRLHAQYPYKLGVAFMMEGYNITTWADQLEEAAKAEESGAEEEETEEKSE